MITKTIRLTVTYDEADAIRLLDRSGWSKSCNGDAYIYEISSSDEDRVTVVRCKDCIHQYISPKNGAKYCGLEPVYGNLGEDHHYCIFGKRK